MFNHKIIVSGLILSLSTWSMGSFAETLAVKTPKIEQILTTSKSITDVEKILKQADIPMDKLIESPYQGLYQIIYQDQTAYVDTTGQYLLIGEIYKLDDIKKNNQGQLPPFEKITSLGTSLLNYAKLGTDLVILDKNQQFVMAGEVIRLTDRVAMSDELRLEVNKVDWTSLPLQQAMKQVKGNGQHKIAVFSDPYCPYCKQLEQTLATLDNVTIYTFLYPVKSNSMKVSESIWCAKNATQAWQDFMLKNRQPEVKKCPNPLQNNLQLGNQVGAYGTPTMIFENGYVLMGAMSKQEIEQILQQMKP
ncbi:thioredoxin fold domain-containing protein [Moraxella sp. ZY210820]|uniref:thioredoxin fold domain-containing protein n=1 Tax=unclassified Moraxella TaxID=2685852 RepID=UPI002731C268|nr:thioredoxin fold domain-containing protein [Moraxella sp. ZY210820]WLF83530.1 thioredoxin fold domain-containing protein [Moraxella sp. ZY210820]